MSPLIIVLAACESSKSPVVSRSTVDRYAESEKLGGRIVTIVQPGDTWYGIAFANSLNVEELAAWNGLNENDKLIIGQRIRLSKPLGFKGVSSSVAASSSKDEPNITVRPAQTKKTLPRKYSETSGRVIAQKPLSSRPQSEPKNTIVPKASNFDKRTVRWEWPVRGKLVSRFSPPSGRKGIDIAARQNQEVKVAASGKVVYQGNGIKGYNNLIIIKHNQDLLSAYAHNQKVYVQEGQWVNENQTISTVGLKNGKPLLHFEIRKKGKPVDPLRYLGKQ